jgi:hypothetical protein
MKSFHIPAEPARVFGTQGTDVIIIFQNIYAIKYDQKIAFLYKILLVYFKNLDLNGF